MGFSKQIYKHLALLFLLSALFYSPFLLAEEVPGHEGWQVIESVSDDGSTPNFYLIDPNGQQVAVDKSSAQRLKAGNMNPKGLFKTAQEAEKAKQPQEAQLAEEATKEKTEDSSGYVIAGESAGTDNTYSAANAGYSVSKDSKAEAARLDSTLVSDTPVDVVSRNTGTEQGMVYSAGAPKWIASSEEDDALKTKLSASTQAAGKTEKAPSNTTAAPSSLGTSLGPSSSPAFASRSFASSRSSSGANRISLGSVPPELAQKIKAAAALGGQTAPSSFANKAEVGLEKTSEKEANKKDPIIALSAANLIVPEKKGAKGGEGGTAGDITVLGKKGRGPASLDLNKAGTTNFGAGSSGQNASGGGGTGANSGALGDISANSATNNFDLCEAERFVFAKPGVYDLPIKASCFHISVRAWGGGGGKAADGSKGGGGSYIQGIIFFPKQQARTLKVVVGGAGGTGSASAGSAGAHGGGGGGSGTKTGGGGGGFSGVFDGSVSQGAAYIVAGGGGGAGVGSAGSAGGVNNQSNSNCAAEGCSHPQGSALQGAGGGNGVPQCDEGFCFNNESSGGGGGGGGYRGGDGGLGGSSSSQGGGGGSSHAIQFYSQSVKSVNGNGPSSGLAGDTDAPTAGNSGSPGAVVVEIAPELQLDP